jgi:hypothetical protein
MYASMLKQWGKHLKACTTTRERESSHMNGSPCVIHDDSDGICHQWNKQWEKKTHQNYSTGCRSGKDHELELQ